MGCHGNGKISYSPNDFFFLRTFCFSHLVGQSEQFNAHEKLSWGASRRPIGTFMPFFVILEMGG